MKSDLFFKNENHISVLRKADEITSKMKLLDTERCVMLSLKFTILRDSGTKGLCEADTKGSREPWSLKG